MLKINLLPIRQLKKRAKAKKQIMAFGAVFIALVAILSLGVVYQLSRIKSAEGAIAELQKEEKRLAPEIAAVDKLKKEKEELQRKISIIKQLRTESSLTVHVLDDVANQVDNTRMWLTSLTQDGGSLALTGIALDNQTVAQFMDDLKKSPYIQSVNLTSSSMKKVSDRNLTEFSLVCAVSLPSPTQEKNDAK